jgi:hypothetical protein
MYKLIGILFLVNTPLGGDQLAFRYPTVLRKSVSDETMRAFTAAHSNKRKSKDKTLSPLSHINLQSSEGISSMMLFEDQEVKEVKYSRRYTSNSLGIGRLMPKMARCLP